MAFALNSYFFFFFNDTATTEIYTLSLHDALPIWEQVRDVDLGALRRLLRARLVGEVVPHLPQEPVLLPQRQRSEEHTSELQSRQYLVCRLLLEKKKKTKHKERDINLHISKRNMY